MAEVQEFQEMAGGEGDYGAPALSAREIAAAAAAEAVRGRPASRPGETFGEREVLESDEQRYSSFEEGVGETVDDVLETVTETATLSSLSAEEISALVEAGIELPTEVPQDFQDPYTRLAQSALQAHRDADARVQESQQQALELAEQIRDIKARLSTPEGQRRLLLTLGLNNPEGFTSARDQLERINSDPEYADMVRRSLEADARLEAAQRIERATNASTAQTKGRQIEDRTVRLAKRFGMDEGIAKEMVAARILQNEARTGKRDITVAEVDEIVTNLGKRFGKQPPVAPKAPSGAARAGQAPQRPAAPTGRERAPVEPPAPARPPAYHDPMDALRSAVKNSAVRLRNAGLK